MIHLLTGREHISRIARAHYDCFTSAAYILDWVDSAPPGVNAEAQLRRSWRDKASMARGARCLPGESSNWEDGYSFRPMGPIGPRSFSGVLEPLNGKALLEGEVIYKRLLKRDPACLSALFNLAELAAYRRKQLGEAEALLGRMDRVIKSGKGDRYGCPGSKWAEWVEKLQRYVRISCSPPVRDLERWEKRCAPEALEMALRRRGGVSPGERPSVVVAGYDQGDEGLRINILLAVRHTKWGTADGHPWNDRLIAMARAFAGGGRKDGELVFAAPRRRVAGVIARALDQHALDQPNPFYSWWRGPVGFQWILAKKIRKGMAPFAFGAREFTQTAAWMDDSELDQARDLYGQLVERRPTCLSGLYNGAIIAARDGNSERARQLIATATNIADSGSGERDGVPGSDWLQVLRCARARLIPDRSPAMELLLLSDTIVEPEKAQQVVDKIFDQHGLEAGELLLTAALAHATPAQRINIRVGNYCNWRFIDLPPWSAEELAEDDHATWIASGKPGASEA